MALSRVVIGSKLSRPQSPSETYSFVWRQLRTSSSNRFLSEASVAAVSLIALWIFLSEMPVLFSSDCLRCIKDKCRLCRALGCSVHLSHSQLFFSTICLFKKPFWICRVCTYVDKYSFKFGLINFISRLFYWIVIHVKLSIDCKFVEVAGTMIQPPWKYAVS